MTDSYSEPGQWKPVRMSQMKRAREMVCRTERTAVGKSGHRPLRKRVVNPV